MSRDEFTITCAADDIHGHKPLEVCARCGLWQGSDRELGHLCCWACGWCEFGAEYGCPKCEEVAGGR